MELFRKTNDFEIFRSRWGGLQRDIFVPTWRFFALDSHDWTSKILFLGGARYFLWGSVLSKSYHPPSDMWSTKFSLQYQAPAQCWQYTWLGAANERVNYTATCRSSNWCCGLVLVVLVIVHQGVGSEDEDVQLRLAFFQWSSRRWRGCSNQQTLLFAPGKDDGQLKHKGTCQMSTALGFLIRCGLKMTKMEQTNQTWTT